MRAAAAESTPSPPLASVFILSAAALAYEVLLVRQFSVIHWHHFAFMVISIALLGYGASGSFITLFRNRLLEHYDSVFIANTLLFAVAAIGCYVSVQHLPFNTLEILWDSSQWQLLLLTYLLLALPFFFTANAIALTLMHYHRQIPLVYSVDLLGAGMGALLIMLLLRELPPDIVLRLLGITGAAAGALALGKLAVGHRRHAVTAVIVCVLGILLLPPGWLELRMSEYKGLAQTLMVKGTSLELHSNSPVAQVDVVQSREIPFRHAPGLSLLSTAAPPEQLAVFSDGDAMTVIDRFDGERSLAYLGDMSSALPYSVHPAPPRVLVLGAETGSLIMQAHHFGARQIDAVEADAQLSSLITGPYAAYSGWREVAGKTRLITRSPRGYAASAAEYDLVVLGPAGASTGGAAGVHALSASYDFTIEAITDYLGLLADEGMLSITLWTSTPARSNLKLLATAVRALQQAGFAQPAVHIAWIRSWNTATLLIKKSALLEQEIDTVRAFCRERGYDLAWLPGIGEDEVNRHQLLQEPVFYDAARAMLAGEQDSARAFIDAYKYDISPAKDDRPYFDNYFRWSSLNELLSLPGGAGIAMIGVGYPTLLVTLAQALVAAIVLILLPLLLTGSLASKDRGVHRHVVVYFLAIGLAFLFIEIAFIQHFTLILSQPLYAVAVALCAFLVFSGLGSLFVQRLMQGRGDSVILPALRFAVLSITVVTLLYVFALDGLGKMIMPWPEPLRILSAFVIAAPLAFAMGMPFPLGLARLQDAHARLVPWAWGVNGCASVLSAVLAVLIAMEIGFNGVMLLAVLLYLLAWMSGRKLC